MGRPTWATCVTAVLLAACTPSETPSVTAAARAAAQDPGPAANPICTSMGPAATVSTSATTCAGCTTQQPELAADGDLATAAKVVQAANTASGYSLRVTAAPGTTFPAGRKAGVLIDPLHVVSAGRGEYYWIRTFLGETLQDEGNGIQLGAGLPYVIGTTKPFDAVELVLDHTTTTVGAIHDVFEICSESLASYPEPLPEERFFARAGNGENWTLQRPGKLVTAEMRDWFKALEAAADSGETIALPASHYTGDALTPFVVQPEQVMNVALTRSKMLDEAAFFQINTVDHTGPFLRVYEGHVVDQPQSIVHLTLADDFMRGVVRVGDELYLVRVGMNGNLPAAVQAGGHPDYAQLQPASSEPESCPADYIPGNDVALPQNSGQRFIPPYVNTGYALGEGAGAELAARIILDADLDAYHQWGRHLPAMMVAIQVEQSVIYRQIGIRFRVVGVHLNTLEGYYPSPLDDVNIAETWARMGAWWGDYMRDRRDIVHLLSGQAPRSFQSHCIGAAGTPMGYFYTATYPETNVADFRNMNFISHEIAHLFSVHHHYGNAVEYPGRLTIESAVPGDKAVFSSLSRGVIRGWAEQYLSEAVE